ncbi:MAG: IS630 family transposase, partial [Acidobacteriota bacterium]|nr:IS630 family transposase [Acidobacteriota bacterium]
MAAPVRARRACSFARSETSARPCLLFARRGHRRHAGQIGRTHRLCLVPRTTPLGRTNLSSAHDLFRDLVHRHPRLRGAVGRRTPHPYQKKPDAEASFRATLAHRLCQAVLTPTPVTWDSALLPLAQLQQMPWPTQPLRVWTQDESRFGLITIQRRRLTLRGIKPLAPSQHELEWSYLYGCVEPLTGENFFLALPALDSALFQLFLDQFAQEDPTALHLIVLDNGPAHIAHQVSRPANVRFVFTPPYTPEVNPMERVWEDLDARIAGATPATLDALVDLLFAELRAYTPAQLASLTGYPF